MKCPIGKNQYSTKSLAEISLIEIHTHWNFRPDQRAQKVYECEFCGEWHLTRKSPKRNERLQGMIDTGEMRPQQRARQWE